ncbi:MAG TPA: phosphoribosyltransferase family protein [Ktedonobacterales bacterium]|nr:phosphoribosyltransferase family protein [Ktedonobacterales bacterium]
MAGRPYFTLIDYETGGNRCDVTPLFADYAAFSALIDDLAALVEPLAFDIVAGIDALGFILGAALALRSHTGFVPIRKGGKLPVAVDSAECVDYTGQRKTLELRQDALKPGARVLLVDEWIETGAQVRTAIQLIEGQGAVVSGIACLHMDNNEQTETLRARYPCVQAAPEL